MGEAARFFFTPFATNNFSYFPNKKDCKTQFYSLFYLN